MADVDGRGQLLLVGALTLAVMLIALAVLLNAAIYTGNVATRDAGPEAGAAIEYEGEATSMARATMETLNDRENESYQHLQQNFTHSVDVWSETARVHSAASLASAEVRVVNITNGSVVRQDMGDSGATSFENVRSNNFQLNLTNESLETINNSDYRNESFRVVFEADDGSGRDMVQVYNRGDDHVWVGVITDDSDRAGQCSVEPTSEDRAVVNILDAQVNGEPCPPLEEFVDRLAKSNDIYFDRTPADPPSGFYRLTISKPSEDINAENADVSKTIYSADLELTYRTAYIDYQTKFTVAPGEDDD